MSAITSLERGSIDRAAATLERAFSPTRCSCGSFPTCHSAGCAARFIRVPLEYGLRYGRVTTSHEAKAACVWLPPAPAMTSRE